MHRILKKIAYSFYAKKIYINFLDYVRKYQNDETLRCLNNYSLVLRSALIKEFNYNDRRVDQAKEYLINSGYIQKSTSTACLYATEDGEKFFQDYYRFCMLGKLAKFTAIFNKNFSAVLSVVAIIISTFSLFVSFASFLKK